MPPYSTLRTFVKALQTGRTNITDSLETLFNDQATIRNHPHFPDLQQPGAMNQPMPDWARQALRGAGLSEDEVSHIDRWPNGEKEKVRIAVVAAIQASRPLHFAWQLTDGPQPEAQIGGPASGGETIVFLSPRSGVQLSALNFGGVEVEA